MPRAFKTAIEPAWLWQIAQALHALGSPWLANKALGRCSVVVRFSDRIVFRRPCLEVLDRILEERTAGAIVSAANSAGGNGHGQ